MASGFDQSGLETALIALYNSSPGTREAAAAGTAQALVDNFTGEGTTLSHAELEDLIAPADDHTQYHNDTRANTWLGTKGLSDLGSADHGALTGRDGDDHAGYLWGLGRGGGQTLNGSNLASQDLTLSSTSHTTKRNILFGTSVYDEVNNRLGINGTPGTYERIYVKDTADHVGIVVETTPTNKAAYFQCKDGTGVDLRFQANGGDCFIGTLSNNDFRLLTNGNEVMKLFTNGSVTVGSPTGGAQGVGTINAQAVYDDGVLLGPDYVFDDPDCVQISLQDVSKFIDKYCHLPWLTSRNQLKEEAVSVGTRLNETIEALENAYLHIIEQQKYVDSFADRMTAVEKILEEK